MVLVTTQKFLITALNSQKLSCYEHHWELPWCCGWCDTAPWTATAASRATCVHVSVSHGWMSYQAKFRAGCEIFRSFYIIQLIYKMSAPNQIALAGQADLWKNRTVGQMLYSVWMKLRLHICLLLLWHWWREQVLITANKKKSFLLMISAEVLVHMSVCVYIYIWTCNYCWPLYYAYNFS